MCAERIEKCVDGASWQAGDTARTILQRADAAMYEHKALLKGGRKTVSDRS